MDQSKLQLPQVSSADEPVACWARWEAKSPALAQDLTREALPPEPSAAWTLPLAAAVVVLVWAIQSCTVPAAVEPPIDPNAVVNAGPVRLHSGPP